MDFDEEEVSSSYSKIPKWDGASSTFHVFTRKMRLYLTEKKILFAIPDINTGNRYPTPGGTGSNDKRAAADVYAFVALESSVT